MMSSEQIKQYLESLVVQQPYAVIDRLNCGSVVRKSMGLSYEVDDCDIDSRLGDFPVGVIPYGPIHRALRSSQGDIFDLFGGFSRIPFSRAFDAGVGECLEKAILVHLSAQRSGFGFLINGCLGIDGEFGVDFHAFNIIFCDGKPFLVDAQNPLAKDATGKITHPYIAPILGIDEDGSFVVAQEWVQGRTYFIS